jgi:hypothetical protein
MVLSGASNGDQVSALAMKRGKSVDLPATGSGTLPTETRRIVAASSR